jgi:hypothetical protein
MDMSNEGNLTERDWGDHKAERLNGQAMLSFSVPTFNDFELSCSCRIIQVVNKHFAM